MSRDFSPPPCMQQDPLVEHNEGYYKVRYISAILHNQTGIAKQTCQALILELLSSTRMPLSEIKSYAALASDYYKFVELCDARPLGGYDFKLPSKDGFYFVFDSVTRRAFIKFISVKERRVIGYFWPLETDGKDGDLKEEQDLDALSGRFAFCGPLHAPRFPE